MLQNHTFFPILGGIENYLHHVSKILKEMGHEPIILCEKHDDRLSDAEIYNGIKIIRHPHYKIPKLVLLAKPKIVSERLKKFLSKHIRDIDLIISRYPHYCFATCSLNVDIPVLYVPPSVHWRQLKKASSKSSLKTVPAVRSLPTAIVNTQSSRTEQSKSMRALILATLLKHAVHSTFNIAQLRPHFKCGICPYLGDCAVPAYSDSGAA